MMKQRIVFAMIMGAITTGVVTITAIVVNMGFFPGLIAVWLKSWLVSYVVAVPFIIFLTPKVQHLVTNLFRAK
jgi:hypothetical protein